VSGPSVGSVDPQLATFGSERQAQYIEAVNTHGSYGKAGKALGVSEFAVRSSIKRLVKLAATRGYSPDHDYVHPVPETHVAKGVSTYYDADGKVRAQWVKSDLRAESYRRHVEEKLGNLIAELPERQVHAAPRNYSTDVIPWVQLGDAHVGMLAHAAEVGENFDLKIAKRELMGAIDHLVEEMPACERAVLNDLGDGTHYENFAGVTEASGHALDYDGRFPKMIDVYVDTMLYLVDRLLTKAKVLDVIINQGNHSRTNDIWIATFLRRLYGHTGRVNVLRNDSVFIAYRMGKTLVMVHHSDKTKPDKLPAVMAKDFAEDWGQTDFHYIDVGHVHHRRVAVDENGAQVESWNHLAASDKWAHDAGYRSSKSITVVLRSKTYGEIGRRTLGIAEIRDRLYGVGHATPVKKPAFTVPA
jgi:hypothetical protein